MISFRHRGNFAKTEKYLTNVSKAINVRNLDYYGQEGVAALRSATPVDTGLTANSWYYRITHNKESVKISFHNSNIQNGVPIALILQYGHGTNNGGWVQGRDYINPAIQPVFDKILNDAWKEVNRQ